MLWNYICFFTRYRIVGNQKRKKISYTEFNCHEFKGKSNTYLSLLFCVQHRDFWDQQQLEKISKIFWTLRNSDNFVV